MNQLWICGKLIGEWEETGNVWSFQGAFDDEKKADDACKDETYFIFPAILNQELPREDSLAKNGRFPRIDDDIPSFVHQYEDDDIPSFVPQYEFVV